MSSASSRDEVLPLAVEARIDDLCHEFESQWSGGNIPAIDDYLNRARLDFGDLDGPAWLLQLLVELVMLDLEYRWRARSEPPGLSRRSAGDGSLPARPRLTNYAARWPQLGDPRNLPLDLVKQEYRVRRLAGDDPKREEYEGRFGPAPIIKKALQQVDRQLNQRGFFAAAVNAGPSATGLVSATPATQPGQLSVRCPQCHDAVSVAVDSTLVSISCQSCGSVFSLVGNEAAPPEAEAPSRIAHFDLLEGLGAGGFGTVWKARDTRLDRVVAVKIPRKGQLTAAEAQQFLREARAAAQLRHPNIVSVHEVGRDDDRIYIISDFVAGETLAARLDLGALSQTDAAALTATVAEALHCAHERGIVHRDLKPANIMLDAEGQPHVMDFGLAKRDVGEVTMTVEGRILGTPAYMSPEQARGLGHQADRRSDIYSLGVILFELLTGKLPFDGSAHLLLARILNDPAPSPRSLDRGVSRDLETICARCLEKEPARRFATAAEVAAELRRFLRGEPILSRPIPAWERTWRRCRARPLVATLAGLLTLVILSTAIVAPFVAAYQAQLRQRAEILAGDLEISLDQQKSLTRAANVLRLAAQAKALSTEAPQRALLLAAEAVDVNLRRGEPATPAAHQALRDVLATVRNHRPVALHQAPLTHLALSGDDRWLLCGDATGTLMACATTANDVGSPKVLQHGRSEKTDKPVLHAIAASRDGRWAATAHDDGTVSVFDLRQADPAAKPLTLGPSGDTVNIVVFSPDNRWLLTGGKDRTPRLFDLTASDPVKSAIDLDELGGAVRAAAFSPDGTRLAVVGDASKGWLWTCRDGIASGPISLGGHEKPITTVAFSSDGRYVATGGLDMTVRVWRVDESNEKPPKPIEFRGHTLPITQVVFSPSGRWLASAATDKTARLWDYTKAENGPPTPRVLAGHESIVRGARFSPDGRRLATFSDDKTIRLWDLTGDEPRAAAIVLRGHDEPVTGACFKRDNRQLWTVSLDRSMRVWNVETLGTGGTPVVLRGESRQMRCVTTSGNGRWLAAGGEDGNVWLWDLTGVPDKPPPVKKVVAHGGIVNSIALSTDGRRMVTCSDDRTAMIWDLTAPNWETAPKVLAAHDGKVQAVVFSHDGRFVVTAGWDAGGTIRQWDLQTLDPAKQPIFERRGLARVLALAVHPREPRFYVASENGLVVSFPFGPTSAKEEPAPIDNKGLVTCLGLNPDGQTLVLGSGKGQVLRWDLSGRYSVPDVLGRHESALTSLAIGPDGRWLATAAYDYTLRLWNLTTDRPQATGALIRVSDHPVNCVAMTPDSRYLVTAGNDGTVRLWPLRMEDLVTHARKIAGRSFSVEERFEYEIGGRP